MKLTLKKHEKILGIDASLTHTGMVVLGCTTGKVLESFTIAPKTRSVRRLIEIGERIRQTIRKHNPTIAVLEGYAFAPTAHRQFSLGELGGLIRVIIFQEAIPLYVVAPATLKKFATGNGHADKSEIMHKVWKKHRVEFTDDHQTDAYVMAQIGKLIRYIQSHNQTFPDNVAKHEKEVARTVLKGENNATDIDRKSATAGK